MRFLLFKPTQQQAASRLIEHIGHPNNGYRLDTVDSLLEVNRLLHNDTYHLLFLQLTSDLDANHAAVSTIRSNHPHIPMVILGDGLPVEDAAQVLKTGADEFFSETIHLTELDARISALLRRSKAPSNNIVTCGPLQYHRLDRVAFLEQTPLALSPRETLVLDTFINTPGKPVSKDRLISILFGSYNTDSANAVEVYVHRLRRKLNHPAIRIRTMRSNGYLLEWDTPSTNTNHNHSIQPQ